MTTPLPNTPVSPLRQKLIDDMNMRHFSVATQRNYIRDVGRFASFLRRPPDTATTEDVRQFQLAQSEAGVPVPTMNSVVSALRFFFTNTLDRPDLARKLVRVSRPRNLPVVLSRDEVARLLNATTSLKHQAALSVAYGAGLRVGEVAMLKVRDIDSERMLIIAFDGTAVTFRYKDYRRSGADRQQVMTLAADEFIRRFLIHVLPRGFHRIRHYGLLAGSARKDCLAKARDVLGVAPAPDEPQAAEASDLRPPCSCCGGTMVIIETFAPWCQPRAPPAARASNRENTHDPA